MGRREYRVVGRVVEYWRSDQWEWIGGVSDDGAVVLRADRFGAAVLGVVMFASVADFCRAVRARQWVVEVL